MFANLVSLLGAQMSKHKQARLKFVQWLAHIRSNANGSARAERATKNTHSHNKALCATFGINASVLQKSFEVAARGVQVKVYSYKVYDMSFIQCYCRARVHPCHVRVAFFAFLLCTNVRQKGLIAFSV